MSAILVRTYRPGDVGTLVVDAGDNAAIDADAGPLPRKQLGPGESCTSATATCTTYPTGATIGSGGDLELGTPAAVAANTECNDRIVGIGEGITVAYTLADDAELGTYKIHCEITTSASRKINFDVWLIVERC